MKSNENDIRNFCGSSFTKTIKIRKSLCLRNDTKMKLGEIFDIDYGEWKKITKKFSDIFVIDQLSQLVALSLA